MNIAVVDDHPFFRLAVKAFLQKSISGSNIFEAGNGREAMELIKRVKLEVMILDITMPVMDGFAFLDLVRKQRVKDFKIIVFTFYDDCALGHRLLSLGVEGYLVKDRSPDHLKKAIEHVMEGRLVYSTVVKEEIPELIRAGKVPSGIISDGERLILNLLAQGKTSKEISAELGYTTKTVETKKLRLEKKFGAKNAAELLSVAYRTGVLSIHAGSHALSWSEINQTKDRF